MKRILLFVVAAVLLLTGTASAGLTVYEYVPGEKVTLDDATGNYWYWNLNDFAFMTYGQQIAAIDDLGTYGHIAGGWHMATRPEITNLFSYTVLETVNSFDFPPDHPDFIGRIEESLQPDYHSTAVFYPQAYHPWTIVSLYPDYYGPYYFPNLGAWVTTAAPVVPAPPAVVLATTGLLCLLGAKLRGRWRRR